MIHKRTVVPCDNLICKPLAANSSDCTLSHARICDSTHVRTGLHWIIASTDRKFPLTENHLKNNLVPLHSCIHAAAA